MATSVDDTAVWSHTLLSVDGRLDSLLRLCESSAQPMRIIDPGQVNAYQNESANLSDLPSFNSVFELIDHHDCVLGHLHVQLP